MSPSRLSIRFCSALSIVAQLVKRHGLDGVVILAESNTAPFLLLTDHIGHVEADKGLNVRLDHYASRLLCSRTSEEKEESHRGGRLTLHSKPGSRALFDPRFRPARRRCPGGTDKTKQGMSGTTSTDGWLTRFRSTISRLRQPNLHGQEES